MKRKLQDIAQISNFYGADEEYVFLGGGNTSFKNEELLYIKPSGVALATIEAEDFLPLKRSHLSKIFSFPADLSELELEALFQATVQGSILPGSSGRPSVEAAVHEAFEQAFVVHLHPTLVNALACSQKGKELCEQLFPSAIWLDYCNPGCTLALLVKKSLDSYQKTLGKAAQIVILQNHGIFVAAETCEEIKEIYNEIIDKLADCCKKAGISKDEVFCAENATNIADTAPALRSMLGNKDAYRATLHYCGKGEAFAGPLTPDHIVYAKTFAFSGNCCEKEISNFKQKYGYLPKVIQLKEDKSLFCAGENLKDAKAVKIALRNARQIEQLSYAFGGPRYMSKGEYEFIENWEAEAYRRSVQANSAGRLLNRVCLVTGAAQGFGLGIAEYLLAEGAQVAIADLNKEGAEKAAANLNQKYGANKAKAFVVDIADENSVEKLFAELLNCYGGLDALVANAGVLRAGSVLELSKNDWDFVTKVNYSGYFLCTKYAGKIMAKQKIASREIFSDIIQINSKSGLEGSNKNAAYAGSKFGGIGLTQSFAKELVEYNIKVNSICPGNYYDGPLWSDPEKGLFKQYLDSGKVPGAKSTEDVLKFYEAQVPMKRGCQPEDVAKAIIYCIEQNYETGQAIPVTGGQVMLH